MKPIKYFSKRPGTTDDGKEYEDLVVAKLALTHATNENTKQFFIACNHKDFGAFDDVILELTTDQGQENYAMQLKHVGNSEKGSLLNKLTGPRGNFSIKKYFEEYKNLGNFITGFKVILFTNYKFDVAEEGTIVKLADEDFHIKISKIQQSSSLFCEEEKCFRFEVVDGASSQDASRIQNYKKFFQQFFLYTNEPNAADAKSKILETFKETFDCDDYASGEQYLNFIAQWNKAERKKRKLSKKFIKKVVAFQLLRPYIQPLIFSAETLDAISEVVKDIVFNFDVVFAGTSCSVYLQEVLGNIKVDEDQVKMSKIAKKYQIAQDQDLSVIRWLMGSHPLIVAASEITYKAINLCQNKKFVVLDDNCQRDKIQNLTIFQNLLDLHEQSTAYQFFEKFSQDWEECMLGRLIILENKIKSLIGMDELIQMAQNGFRIGEGLETLPEPYIERHLTTIVVNSDYLDFNESTPTDCNIVEINNHTFHIRPDKKLEWIRSTNGVDDLQKFREFSDFGIPESELLSLDLGPVTVICGEPGMGKTTLVKNLKNKYAGTFWKIIVYPKDHSIFFRTIKDLEHAGEHFITYIIQETNASGKTFGSKLLQILREKGRLVLFWDAIDEVSADDFDLVINIVIQLSKKGFKQFVTARTHLAKTLEMKLGVFSRTIKPFVDEEQKTYIQDRLRCPRDKVHEVVVKITKYIDMVRSSDVLGIPLQISMLAELFNENFEKCNTLFEDVWSITSLYRYSIDEKLNIFLNKSNIGGCENKFIKRIIDSFKTDLLDLYERTSLTLFLGQETLQQLNITGEELLEKSKMDNYGDGIITGVTPDGKPNFIHQSYAEYFAAKYFFKNHKLIRNFSKIIFEESFRNIRFMFDLLMADGSLPHLAVLYRNFEILERCDSQLTSKDSGGRNLLHLASSWGQFHPILTITAGNSSVEIDDGEAEFCQADNSEYSRILSFLLQRLNPNERDSLHNLDCFSYADRSLSFFAVDRLAQYHKTNFMDHHSLERICTVCYYSIKFNYHNLFQLIKEIPFANTTKGWTFVHLAAFHNNVVCLKKLLKSNQKKSLIRCLTLDCYRKMVNVCDINGETPIYLAAEQNHYEAAKLLIRHGANVNIGNQYGWNAFHMASKNGHYDTVKLFLAQGADVNATNATGWTSLHVASRHRHLDVVRLLLKHKANIHATSKDKSTPLYAASGGNFPEIVMMLLKHGAKVNVATVLGWTPLHVACQSGYVEVAKLLLEHGAQCNAADNFGRTPLFGACRNGHYEIVELLVQNGIDVDKWDSRGLTAIYLAKQQGNERIVQLLMNCNLYII